jgi:hypothetical protein
MNLAEQLAALRGKGFSEEQARVISLMREAATVAFREWPESFILYGGANLVLFQESVRHSADLDLHLRANLPPTEQVANAFRQGLEPLAKLLEHHPLDIDVFRSDKDLLKIGVSAPEGAVLFTIDLNRMGSVIESGIDEQVLEDLGTANAANVKFVSRDHLLLQKAEAFLLRRVVKARDAYDIRFLLDRGAALRGHSVIIWQIVSSEISIENTSSSALRVSRTAFVRPSSRGSCQTIDTKHSKRRIFSR